MGDFGLFPKVPKLWPPPTNSRNLPVLISGPSKTRGIPRKVAISANYPVSGFPRVPQTTPREPPPGRGFRGVVWGQFRDLFRSPVSGPQTWGPGRGFQGGSLGVPPNYPLPTPSREGGLGVPWGDPPQGTPPGTPSLGYLGGSRNGDGWWTLWFGYPLQGLGGASFASLGVPPQSRETCQTWSNWGSKTGHFFRQLLA